MYRLDSFCGATTIRAMKPRPTHVIIHQLTRFREDDGSHGYYPDHKIDAIANPVHGKVMVTPFASAQLLDGSADVANLDEALSVLYAGWAGGWMGEVSEKACSNTQRVQRHERI